MAQKNVVAPRLPNAPEAYDPAYINKLLGQLRLYFNQIDNIGPISVTSQKNGADVISALSFPPAPSTVSPNLPTEADLANLRIGDAYYDTTAGNVLKVKV
jgi:hypothetical protein